MYRRARSPCERRTLSVIIYNSRKAQTGNVPSRAAGVAEGSANPEAVAKYPVGSTSIGSQSITLRTRKPNA
tara:strand:- start:447 stop:659 length:213 start_codon:yes stop_codon:yes gene_type:complete